MKKTYAICTVLLSTVSIGCTDPIVGTWLTGPSYTVDGESMDFPFPYDDYSVRAIQMEFVAPFGDPEVTGLFDYLVEEHESSVLNYSLEVTRNGGGSYTIEASGGDTINCQREDSSL